MKSATVVATIVAFGLAAPTTAAVSQAVGRPLKAAQAAAAGGSTASAISSINSARAAASTAEERTAVSKMAAYVYTRAGQYGRAAQELESTGASPRQLASLYYNAGNYAKAVELAKRAGGSDMQVLIAQAASKQGRHAEAVTAYSKLIAAEGPKPVYLENLAGAQYKAGDKRAYLATTQKLIKIDASPARWKTLLVNFQQNQLRPEAKLALYHLMSATGTIDRPQDYLEFAKLALINRQAGIARGELAKAGSLGTDAMSQNIAAAAAKLAAAAPAQAPKLAASPATALQGGNMYLGLGQNGPAVAAFDRVIPAGGYPAEQARVWKGIAQVRGGQPGPARASFASVPETSPMRDIADLWSLYASTRGSSAPAPTAVVAAS